MVERVAYFLHQYKYLTISTAKLVDKPNGKAEGRRGNQKEYFPRFCSKRNSLWYISKLLPSNYLGVLKLDQFEEFIASPFLEHVTFTTKDPWFSQHNNTVNRGGK